MAAEATRMTAVTHAPGRARRVKIEPGTILRHIILIFFCIVAMVPVLWIFSMSFKSVDEAYTSVSFWPQHPSWNAYTYAFANIPELPHYFLNSVIVTTSGMVGVLIISCLAGYALVWLEFPGRALILGGMAASLFFPTQITSIIGIYQVTANLNLIDTLIGLILPYIAINLVVSTFIMQGIFRSLPKELLEAARADGSSVLRTFFQIALPLCGNGVVVVAMINFIAMWGEFLIVFTLSSTVASRTLTVGMQEATAGTGVWEWPRIAAVFVVMIVPPIVLFVGLQRWFMKGLMEGALRQ
jgi:ABC-type glycerol-3-phosphate transport system permease component